MAAPCASCWYRHIPPMSSSRLPSKPPLGSGTNPCKLFLPFQPRSLRGTNSFSFSPVFFFSILSIFPYEISRDRQPLMNHKVFPPSLNPFDNVTSIGALSISRVLLPLCAPNFLCFEVHLFLQVCFSRRDERKPAFLFFDLTVFISFHDHLPFTPPLPKVRAPLLEEFFVFDLARISIVFPFLLPGLILLDNLRLGCPLVL